MARVFSDNGFGQSNRWKSLRYLQRKSQWAGPLGMSIEKVTGKKKIKLKGVPNCQYLSRDRKKYAKPKLTW